MWRKDKERQTDYFSRLKLAVPAQQLIKTSKHAIDFGSGGGVMFWNILHVPDGLTPNNCASTKSYQAPYHEVSASIIFCMIFMQNVDQHSWLQNELPRKADCMT